MKSLCMVLALVAALDVATVNAQGTSDTHALTGAALVQALRSGGYVLVMRHASSPFAVPTKDTADADNPGLERQLDASGRASAHEMGVAMRQLGLPIGAVLSSPTYRARQTARLAALGAPTLVAQLDEGPRGMQSGGEPERTAWLRAKVAAQPRSGTDTLVITHTPNIAAAFGAGVKNIEPGECLVFRPDGKGAAEIVARIKAAQWAQLRAP